MKWLTKKRKPAEPKTTERDIFKFWDGSTWRHADPLPIWYKLWQIEDVEGLIQRTINNEIESTTELISSIRQLFDLPEYNPESNAGVTELEAMGVLTAYLSYTTELKKKHGPLPMPWQKLAPMPQSENSPTNSDADSSFNPPESPNDGQSTVSTHSVQP